MNDQALRPHAFTTRSFIEEETPIVESSIEEGILAHGSETIFWKTLVTHFDSAIHQLESINEEAMAHGMALDEIGRNALVISQVKGVLRKIINGVTDAHEAVEARNGKAQ